MVFVRHSVSVERIVKVLLMEIARHPKLLCYCSVCQLKLIPFLAEDVAEFDGKRHNATDLFLSVTAVC
jgi:hypothetical protein